LKKFDVPTSILKVYPGALYVMCSTLKDRVNAELGAVMKQCRQ